MDFDLTEEQRAIQHAVRAVVQRFDADYWLDRDDDGEFPHAFHGAMAEAGWLGITMPEQYGGAGLGVTEAALMMHEVVSNGGGIAAASTVHINLFGPHPNKLMWTVEAAAMPPPLLTTSCIISAASVTPRPAPPYCSGMVMPSQPASAMAP